MILTYGYEGVINSLKEGSFYLKTGETTDEDGYTYSQGEHFGVSDDDSVGIAQMFGKRVRIVVTSEITIIDE
jgi:hypothetical protein